MYYMVICSAGMIFIFEYNALCAILRGMGESKLPMVFVGIASIINVILDIIFVGPCGWGAGGAAAATVIAQAVSCICAAVYLYRHKEAAQFDFKLRSFGIDKEQLKALCRLGVPGVIQMLMITFSLAYVNSKINLYDVTASAVDTVGNKLATIVNILTGAVSVASGSMVAQSFAAGKMDRIKKIVHVALAVGLIWFAVMALCYLFLPRQIFGIFTTDEAVLNMAPKYCRIMVLWLLAACTMNAPYAVVKGIGFASYDMFVGIMDGVVARIGLAMLLGHIAGLYGYWTGNAIAGFVTTFLMGGYYLTGKWKTRKVITR
jgi:putative MATE family efflux protein